MKEAFDYLTIKNEQSLLPIFFIREKALRVYGYIKSIKNDFCGMKFSIAGMVMFV